MIRMRRFFVVGLLAGAMLTTGRAAADAVWGEPFQLRQPDGALVDVKIWGDEFYQIVESPDGYTLVRDPDTGVICYAVVSPDGQRLISTGVPLGSQAKSGLNLTPHARISTESVRQQVSAARMRLMPRRPVSAAKVGPPTLGNVQGICIIVDFSDQAATIPRDEIDHFCNQAGYTGYGNNGSVRDFYYDVSKGLFNYTNYVPAAYYRALHPKSYYDNPSVPTGPGASELIGEAMADLDAHGFDFSQYDANGDGLIDAVNCFYAGYTSSGWSMGLWPHSGIMFFEADGVTAIQYQITYMGNSLRIGTFCHENGHLVFWWPDLYDYGYDSTGAGRYCLMAYGNNADSGRNPIEPCAYLKDSAGWTTTNVLSAGIQASIPVTADSGVIYKYPNPTNPNEYYLIENRQQTGRDAGLPDAGLAIWHIDTMGSNDFNEMTRDRHFKAAVVQADGRWDLEHDMNSGDATDLWKAPTYRLCGPTTSPNTNWWTTLPSYLRVGNVSASGPTMTFDYRGLGRSDQDYDHDGISDYDETRDLDPSTLGVENPFDPTDPDVTGNNREDAPDGISDGENDYDGDGMTNADESRAGSNPIDPQSGLPAASVMGLMLLVLATATVAPILMRRQHRRT